MKKLIVFLTFFSFLTLGLTNTAKAEEEQPPCITVKATCPNGTTYTALVCSGADWRFYSEYYCGLPMD